VTRNAALRIRAEYDRNTLQHTPHTATHCQTLQHIKVYGQSMASGTRLPNEPQRPRTGSPEESVNQLDNVCSTRLARDYGEEVGNLSVRQ